MIPSAQRPWDVSQQEGTLYPQVAWAEVKTFYCASVLRDDKAFVSRHMSNWTPHIMFLYYNRCVKWRHNFKQHELSRTDNTQAYVRCHPLPLTAHLLISTDSKNKKQRGIWGSLGRSEKRTTFLFTLSWHSFTKQHSTVWPFSSTWSASFWFRIVFSRFGSLTCGDAVSGSRLWPAGPLPPADVWPPAGPAAPDGSCGRSRPGGSRLEESERRNLFRCNRH